MTERTDKVELFIAMSVEEVLERGAQGGSSRGNLHECSNSGEPA